MKKLLLLFILAYSMATQAQRTNEGDTPVAFVNPATKENVYLKLNTNWFVRDNNVFKSFTSKEKKAKVMTAGIAEIDFNNALQTAKENKSFKTQLLNADIIKATEEYTENGTSMLSFSYGVRAGNGRVLSMLVIINKESRAEWETYFDTVAATLSLK